MSQALDAKIKFAKMQNLGHSPKFDPPKLPAIIYGTACGIVQTVNEYCTACSETFFTLSLSTTGCRNSAHYSKNEETHSLDFSKLSLRNSLNTCM